MKSLIPLFTLLTVPLLAQNTVFTIPQGYTRITIPGATGGSPTLTVISANLFNDLEFSDNAVINADFDADPDGNADTSDTTQTITVSGAPFTTNQFGTEPYLAQIINASGDEEAFLISAHTTNTITVDASFDLLTNSRFNTDSTVKIRKANTVGSILGTTATPFTSTDRVFIWDGDSWQTLIAVNGDWFFFGGPDSGMNATGAVIFPYEGIFIQRAETTDAILTFFGEVPIAPQASTVPGSCLLYTSPSPRD